MKNCIISRKINDAGMSDEIIAILYCEVKVKNPFSYSYADYFPVE